MVDFFIYKEGGESHMWQRVLITVLVTVVTAVLNDIAENEI